VAPDAVALSSHEAYADDASAWVCPLGVRRGRGVGLRFGTRRAGVTFTFAQIVRRRKVARGTLAYTTAPGRHRVSFEGRIGKQQLPPGSYMVAVGATDPSIGQHSRTYRLRFTALRGR
jgi:hypothetical protein